MRRHVERPGVLPVHQVAGTPQVLELVGPHRTSIGLTPADLGVVVGANRAQGREKVTRNSKIGEEGR